MEWDPSLSGLAYTVRKLAEYAKSNQSALIPCALCLSSMTLSWVSALSSIQDKLKSASRNKPFPTKIVSGSGVCYYNRKQTRTGRNLHSSEVLGYLLKKLLVGDDKW